MKLGSVNKTDKRNKLTSYKLDDDLMSLSSCDDYCRFSKFKPMCSNFETGSVKSVKSVNLQTVKRTFSLIVTYHLTKTANRTKKYLTQLSQYCFE